MKFGNTLIIGNTMIDEMRIGGLTMDRTFSDKKSGRIMYKPCDAKF